MQEINSVLLKLHMCVLVLFGLNVEANKVITPRTFAYQCLPLEVK